MIGESLRKGFHCTAGPMAPDFLADLNVDKAFMATNVFTIKWGSTTPGDQHAEMKRRFFRIAAEVIMLADSSKIEKISFVKFADLSMIDKLITDSGLSSKLLAAIRKASDSAELIVV